MTLAIFTLLLSFIPILYLFVIGLGISVSLLGLLTLVVYERRFQENFSISGYFSWSYLLNFNIQERLFPERKLSRQAFRTMRLGIVAIFLNLFLYGLLSIHSWACIILPLQRELGPVKESFRKTGPALLKEKTGTKKTRLPNRTDGKKILWA